MARPKIPPAAEHKSLLKIVHPAKAPIVHANARDGVSIDSPLPVAPGLQLNPDEITLVLRYRAATDDAKEIQLAMTAVYAKSFPRYVAPRLRLISARDA